MGNIHTVYHRSSPNDKWHWNKECPEFPVNSSEAMVSTIKTSIEELCPICLELEVNIQQSHLKLKERTKKKN